MEEKFLAHICLKEGGRVEQRIDSHCRNTAAYTSEKLRECGMFYMGYLAGLLHDMGKYTDKFQEYLEKAFSGENVIKGSVNHTFAGVIYLFEKYHIGKQRGYSTMTCEIIAYAIGAHHGEFDCVDQNSRSGFEHRLEVDREEIGYQQAVERFLLYCAHEKELEELFVKATDEVHVLYDQIVKDYKKKKTSVNCMLGNLTRMLLSALINGDRMDTAEFMEGITQKNCRATKTLWEENLSYMEEKLNHFPKDTSINQMRSLISEECRKFAERGNGIYKISVPTGSGKTLATLRYSLALAQKENKDRIIFIIPLLSVLDQNSKVIREYISDTDMILEHHSNIVQITDDKKELDEYELLTDTWGAPVVISTLYQLLMILFSDKTSAIRRMQSLNNSILVIDEAQSIPFKVTYLFNMVANYLADYCNTTILLSSATQPCFEQVKMPLKFTEEPDMIIKTPEMWKVFKRTRILNGITPEGMTIPELAQMNLSLIKSSSSVLTICNTKKTARDVYKQVKLQDVEDEYIIFHLSTSMCPRHRLDVLKEINECLKAKRKIICIATQLVEAGIDFSFENVIRVYAGMDNVAQAAGRCNRNNDFCHICNVYLVKLKEENLSRLKDIQIAQNCTLNFWMAYEKNPRRFKEEPLSDESLSFYYAELFEILESLQVFEYLVKNENGDQEKLLDLLASNEKYSKRPEYKGTYFLHQAFKTAGSLFTVFDNKTTDILVPYNQEAKELIADLFSQKAKFDLGYVRERLQKAKPYTIQIWDYQKETMYREGMIYSDPSGHLLALQAQWYSRETGLEMENYMI